MNIGQTTALTANTTSGRDGAVDTNAARNKMIENMDAFLLMLTTQLKNQDPLSPVESTEFTNQLVGFAQVEQQIGINENLGSLQSLYRQSQHSLALSFLGRYAEIVDDQFTMENGKARVAYVLDRQARATEVTIRNDKGEVVHTSAGKVAPGNHIFDWDGLTKDGTRAPDGTYTFDVKAWYGDAKEGVPVTTVVEARITAVSTHGNDTYVTINGMALPMTDIRTISEGPRL